MTTCSKCDKKLGFLSVKHKIENDKIVCRSCFNQSKKKQEEKDRKIILEHASRYLSGKFKVAMAIAAFYGEEWFRELVDTHSINRLKENIENLLVQQNNSVNQGMSGDDIDNISSMVEAYESLLIFVDDLEKMYKLLSKKGVEISYPELVKIFAEVSNDNINERIESEQESYLEPAYKAISNKLGQDITKERIIKEFMKLPLDPNDDISDISKLLDKFKMEYEQNVLKDLIAKIKEEMELEDFEENMGTTTKIDIGDFEHLTGYQFEEYLKEIFKYLGYTAIKTSLSGDQGADLVLTKDNKKTIVQAKKYNGSVSNGAVQEIAAAKNYYKADKALVVTNSSFTKSAIDLALANNVELWDGKRLNNIIKEIKDKEQQRSGHYKKEVLTSVEKGAKTHQIAAICPFCQQEFEHEVNIEELEKADVSEGISSDVVCPNCGKTLRGKIRIQS